MTHVGTFQRTRDGWRLFRTTAFAGHEVNQFRQIARSRLDHDARLVGFDGPHADSEFTGDFPIVTTMRDERGNLPFARLARILRPYAQHDTAETIGVAI